MHVAPIGYAGRSGLWILRSMVNKEPVADYFQYFVETAQADELGFLTYRESTLASLLGASFPQCDVSEYSWCSTVGESATRTCPKCTF